MIKKAMVKTIIGAALCALTMIACSFSGVAPNASSELQLQGTHLALQATQLSIQAEQLAATQTAMIMSVPAEVPTATLALVSPPAVDVPGEIINSNGVYFEYPAWLASGVTASMYDAPPANQDDPFFAIEPDHRIFEFTGYSLADYFLTPEILVYPLNEFRQINPAAAQQIARLEEILQMQGLGATRPESMPFIPIFNAGQAFYSKFDFINTDYVRGIRYLTQYQQDVYPIKNGNMFYTYQGITTDGKYYVAAIFPESHQILNQNDQFEYTSEFADNFEAIMAQTGDQLQAQPDPSFMPGLDALDAIIRSLRVQ